MRFKLPASLLALVCLASLTGCTTTPKPADGRPVLTSQYIATLAQVTRVPQSNPLLDEGLIPEPVLHLVIAYQTAVRTNHYRPLAKFHEPQGHGNLEDTLLAVEARSTPKLAVLTNVTRSQASLGRVSYEFAFKLLGRSDSSARGLIMETTPDGKAWIISNNY